MTARKTPKKMPVAAFRKATARNAAMASGRKDAIAAVASRAKIRKQRDRVVQAHHETLRKGMPSKGPRSKVPGVLAKSADVGILVAEGDSWFDYPLCDVLKILDDRFGYRIESVSHRGDAVEGMAYGGGQLEEVVQCLDRIAQDGKVPTAILVSGGGNDVAGPEFAMLLEHKQSPIPGLNATVLDGVIDQRVATAYVKILSRITATCEELWPNERKIPIMVHGYDYPVPDGRGFLGGWGPLPGPWFEPGFRLKDYGSLSERIAIAATLIDRFNAMLESVVAMPTFKHVTYVNLRGTLSTNLNDYKKWWGNELHPTPGGFAAIADLFARTLRGL